MVYRRTWLTIISGFFEPIFYLFALGFGLGHFVGEVHGVSYASYIAPALLASSAMNGAVYDGMTNVFWKLRYGKVYDAMLSTPVVADGRRDRRDGVGAVPRSPLRVGLRDHDRRARAHPLVVGTADAAGRDGRRLRFAGMAIGTSTFLRSWQDFDTVQLVQLPMFLFSATFYPALGLPGRHPVVRPDLAALPRDPAHPLADARHRRPDHPRARRLPVALGCFGIWLARRRMAGLLLTLDLRVRRGAELVRREQ